MNHSNIPIAGIFQRMDFIKGVETGFYQRSRKQMTSSLKSGDLTILFSIMRRVMEIQQTFNKYLWNHEQAMAVII